MLVKCQYCGKEVKDTVIKQHQALNGACKKIQSDLASVSDTISENIEASKASQEKTPAKPVKKQGSDSWLDDKWNSNTYTPSNMTHVELKDPRMRTRWARPNKVDYWKAEGLKIATYNEVKNLNAFTIQDGETTDSVVRRRELTLMYAPITYLEARKKHVRSKIVNPDDIKQEYAAKFAQSKGGARMIGEEEAKNMPIYKTDPSVDQVQ